MFFQIREKLQVVKHCQDFAPVTHLIFTFGEMCLQDTDSRKMQKAHLLPWSNLSLFSCWGWWWTRSEMRQRWQPHRTLLHWTCSGRSEGVVWLCFRREKSTMMRQSKISAAMSRASKVLCVVTEHLNVSYYYLWFTGLSTATKLAKMEKKIANSKLISNYQFECKTIFPLNHVAKEQHTPCLSPSKLTMWYKMWTTTVHLSMVSNYIDVPKLICWFIQVKLKYVAPLGPNLFVPWKTTTRIWSRISDDFQQYNSLEASIWKFHSNICQQ